MQITISKPTLALDVQIAVSKEQARHYLNGFYVEETESGILLVSTDGHRMVIIHDPHGSIEGHTGPLKLPQTFLKQIKPTIRGKDGITLSIISDGATSAASLNDESGRSILQCSDVVIDGVFPDWRRVLPVLDMKKAFVPAIFNAEYLQAFGSLKPDRSTNGVMAYGNSNLQEQLPAVGHTCFLENPVEDVEGKRRKDGYKKGTEQLDNRLAKEQGWPEQIEHC